MYFQWTPRVTARAELAAMIKKNHLKLAKEHGLTEADLNELESQGNLALAAEREQKEHLAQVASERTGRKLTAQDIFSREDRLRNRLPAVVADLADTHRGLSDWLRSLSFARYRVRELAPAPGAQVDQDEEVKKLARVEREDIPARLAALAGVCAALGKKGREPILQAFAARGLSTADIAELGADADQLARAGRNVSRGSEATAREAKAAKAQHEKWTTCRRMLRAVATNHPDLQSKLSEC